MTSETIYLRDLVAVDAGFKPSVQLPFDFDNPDINKRLVSGFIPTSQSIEILSELARSLDQNSTERARTLVGTFGTGKSDLLLLICNYFAHNVTDPLMAPFYERLREISPAQAGIIRGRREGRLPYLVVLLQADTVSAFPGFVLHGLQHALERAGLGHLMSKTRYAAAREQISVWQRDGHARYTDFCKLLQEHEERDVDSLLTALSGAQADDALQRFLRTFRAVTGADFNIYGYSQPHEAYAAVAEALVTAGTHSGILLVCDEFTAFMERFQSAMDQQLREIDSETKAVENLAERSGSSGKSQVHFIVASLESFASAAGGIGSRTAADATERIGGRFKQHSLLVQGSEELIRGAIKRLPGAGTSFTLPHHQRDELTVIAEAIWRSQGRDREWIRNVIVDGSFPLHPITTYALPLINQKVAQSQRTMFLFMQDEAGLRGFIQRETLHDGRPNWMQLLTADLLFDYFRESIATKKSEINDAYELAEQQLRAATVETGLAKRVIALIALCETIGSDLFLRPTRLFLRRALNLPPADEIELNQALKLLEDLDAIEAPSDVESANGIFRLPMRGWVSTKSLRRRITSRAQNLSGVNVELLQSKHSPQALLAAEYNRKRGSHRKLSAYYISLVRLRSGHLLKQDLEDQRNRDGLLWYVIASSDGERAEAQSIARDLTEQNPRLVIAVPNAPTNILSALRDYQALVSLRGDPDLEQVNKPYLEDRGKIGYEYKQRLDEALKKLEDPREWEWFAAGRGASGLAKSQIDQMVNQLAEKVFHSTPNTSLQQHFKPDDLGSTITKAIEQILKGEIKLDRSAKSAVDNVLRTGAVSLGLLQAEQVQGSFEPYSLADPAASASIASGVIMRKIHEHLASGKPWGHLVGELRQPPFGLYDSVLIFFLAHFTARNNESLSIHQGSTAGRTLDVDTNLLKRMLERPQDYSIRFQPLSEHEKRWLYGLVTRGLRQTDFTPPPGTTLRAAVATRVKSWIARQQLPAFAVKISAEQTTNILDSNDPVIVSAMQEVIRCYTAEGDMSTLLLSELPQHLGAPVRHSEWTQATIDELLGHWMAVCELITRLPSALKKQAFQRVAAIFGTVTTTDPAAYWDIIYRWRLNRGAVQADRLPSLPRELFRLTNTPTGSIEQTLLDEFARRPTVVGLEYQRWPDLERYERFFTELDKAHTEIDQAWKDVAAGDERWREGIARAASGRAMTGVTIEQVARELFAWSTAVAWPTCAQALTLDQLQLIYPDVPIETCRDLTQLLMRFDYDEQRWRQDLQDNLAKAFNIQSFSRDEVSTAIKRIERVLPLATGLGMHLRRYVLNQITQLFRASLGLPETTAFENVIVQWQARFTIPEPNDLSSEAKGMLFNIQTSAGDPESLILTLLPRSLAVVGLPVQHWNSFTLVEVYKQQITQLITEITEYEPVIVTLKRWLTGIVHVIRHKAMVNPPHERKRLISVVRTELQSWLSERQLPAFSAHMSLEDLHAIIPGSNDHVIALAQQLLQSTKGEAATVMVLADLAGLSPEPASWTEQDVEQALAHLHNACQVLEKLPQNMRDRILGAIGRVFSPEVHSSDLVGVMREWRARYIILPGDVLPSNARILYDSLGTLDNDVEDLLLQRLPVRIADVQASYKTWDRWNIHELYLAALKDAAKEVEIRGAVNSVGEHTSIFWREFSERLRALSPDDQRWIVKAFRDEFQQ